MNKDQYFTAFRSELEKMFEITRRKNADYTGNDPSPFANFMKVEHLGICSAEVGVLTRMSDKFSRIASFVQNNELQVKDESVEDTLRDNAIYSVMLLLMIRSKKIAAQDALKAIRTGQGINSVFEEEKPKAVLLELEIFDRMKTFIDKCMSWSASTVSMEQHELRKILGIIQEEKVK